MGITSGISGPRSFFLEHRTLILILLAALALRLGFFAAVRPWQDNYITSKIIMIDAEPYHNIAVNILKDRSFEHTDTYRTPGYPVFLAFCYLLFGVKPWTAVLVQVFIGVFTVFLVYLWTRDWLGQKAAGAASFLFAIEPHVIIYGACLLTETLFVCTVLLAMFLWHRGMRSRKLVLIAAAGLLMGYTALIKPIALVFPFAVLFMALFYRSIDLRFKARSVAVYSLLFLAVMSSWMFKNYTQYGHFSLTHINGFNLLYVSAAYTEVARTGKTYAEVCADFDAVARKEGAYATSDLFEQSRIFSRIGSRYIRSNLGIYARRHLIGMATLFTNLASTDTMDLVGMKRMQKKYNVYEFHNFITMITWYFQNKTSSEIIFGLLVSMFLALTYLFAAFGTWTAFREKRYLCLTVNLAVAFYFCFMTGVFGVARYRLPVIPFYILFSGYGIIAAYTNFTGRRFRPGTGDT